MISAKATFNWSIYVDCPYCNENLDLVEKDAENGYVLSGYIFNNDWNLAEGYEVTCSCGKEFQIKEIVY